MAILDILRIIILENSLVFINVWWIVHVLVGYILWKKFKLSIKTVLIIIIGFEIIEPMFPNLFMGETALDQLWDIVGGLLGYFIAKEYRR